MTFFDVPTDDELSPEVRQILEEHRRLLGGESTSVLDDVEKEVLTTVHRFGGWLSGKALSLCGHVDGDE